jgi:plastocyanin
MKKLYSLFLSGVFIFCCAFTSTAVIRTVQVSEFSFSPSTVNANVNDTIRWVWVNGSHTTTSTSVPAGAAPWDSPLNSGSQSFSYKITRSGVYNYVCTPHSSMMQGVINVASGSGIGTSDLEMLSIRPQPFKDYITISGIDPGSALDVELFDLTGRVVQHENILQPSAQGSYTMNTSGLKPGIYICRFTAGERRHSLRIVRE